MKSLKVLTMVLAAALLFSGCSRIRSILGRGLATEPAETQQPVASVGTSAGNSAASQPDETVAPGAASVGIPVCAEVSVTYESPVVTVGGIGEDGTLLWQREFPLAEETELSPWCEATLLDGRAYLQVGYAMLALDASSGETIWTSAIRGGLCRPVVRDGIVYTCSYYGEPLIGISAQDGSTVFTAGNVDDDFFWPYLLEMEGDNLIVLFGNSGADDKVGMAVFDLRGELLHYEVVE